MSGKPNILNRWPAGLQILFLLGMVIAGATIFPLLGIALINPLYGVNVMELLLQVSGNDAASIKNDLNKINALKFLQLLSSIGAFVIPAIIFAGLKSDPFYYLRVTKFSKPILYPLALLIIIAAIPIINLSLELNQHLEFLGSFFDYLKSSEEKSEKALEVLLFMPGIGDLVFNLIVIAIVPAIGEEFLFRGCVQQVLFERTKKIHLTIWITAVIFSFVHFQFLGFLPRMLLGVVMGYLFYYSGSIWVNILAHTFNNGWQVVAAYLYDKNLISFNINDDGNLPWLYVISSIPVLAALLYFLYKQRVENPSPQVITVTEPPAQ